jgi:hypothetical protein
MSSPPNQNAVPPTAYIVSVFIRSEERERERERETRKNAREIYIIYCQEQRRTIVSNAEGIPIFAHPKLN